MPKVVNLWPDKKLTCPGCQKKITITPAPYRENRCPECGELTTVVTEDDQLFQACEEDSDP